MRKGSRHSPEARKKMSESMTNPSAETRRKMSLAKKGKPLSSEHISHIRTALSGENHPLYGRHHSEETREKISQKLTGRKYGPMSIETREKIAITKRGEKNPNWGRRYSSDERAKLSAHFVGENNPNFGKTASEETRRKQSIARKGKRCGEESSNWRGGISFEPYCPKFNNDLRRRIRAFFEYRCVACGKHTKENITSNGDSWQLSCHHVEYNKSACCDGKPVRFAALCIKCHNRTNHSRERWEVMIHRIIDEIYDGKSYFTKEEMSKCV